MNNTKDYSGALSTMRKVLLQEAGQIEKTVNTLDEKYERLITLCMECAGKVVLTGMGKSGHVAKKISATLASLGTPSFYVHPAEAAHGDLGMIQQSDVVIMISKSGETDELLQLSASLKAIGCIVVGIFCRKESSLERYCDLTIIVPIAREACVNNLAPTTSTTVIMALGDALAIALSELKGFNAQNFALYHPQGSLGKRLLTTAGNLIKCTRDAVSVKKDENVKKVLWTITKNHLGAAAVVDDEGYLIGLITDGDIRRALEQKENILQEVVTEIMTVSPIYAEETMLAVDIFQLMQERKISVVPVIDNEKKLKSIISMHDIVDAGIVN